MARCDNALRKATGIPLTAARAASRTVAQMPRSEAPQWGMRERFIIKHQRIADNLLQRTSLRPAHGLLQLIASKMGKRAQNFSKKPLPVPRSLVL
jgi:hypothetical protein